MKRSAFLFSAAVFLLPMTVLGQERDPLNEYIGAAEGVFIPFKGKAGFSLLGDFAIQTNGGFRFGGEMEYRNYKAEMLDVDDVPIDTIGVRFVTRYFFPVEVVKPYVGTGVGFSINIVDADKIEEESSDTKVINDVGAGIGILGLVGVEVPLGERFAIFGEGRLGYDAQFVDDGDLSIENLGGFGTLGGVRFKS